MNESHIGGAHVDGNVDSHGFTGRDAVTVNVPIGKIDNLHTDLSLLHGDLNNMRFSVHEIKAGIDTATRQINFISYVLVFIIVILIVKLMQ